MNDEHHDEPMPVAKPPLESQARKALVWLAVAVLAVAMAMLMVSMNEILAVWFRYQYVGFARAIMAIIIAGLALLVIFRLTQTKN